MKVLTPEERESRKKYAEYRYELWSMLADKGAVLIESELNEIQNLLLKNVDLINEVKNMS
jgi:hypothetical protein